MRLTLLFFSLLLVPSAFAGGAVGFNLTWYPTPQYPSNDIANGADCEVTTGVVIADSHREADS
jgi:hypothetical protein